MSFRTREARSGIQPLAGASAPDGGVRAARTDIYRTPPLFTGGPV